MIRPPILVGLLAVLACRPYAPADVERPRDAAQLVETAGLREAPPTAKVEYFATVGDARLVRADFDAILALKLAKYTERDREVPATALARYQRSIAERLARHEQLAQESRRLGIEVDAEMLATLEAFARDGIADWPEHLRRRGESEQSIRAMLVADLQETALLEHRVGPVEEADVVARYEQEKPEHTAKKGWVRAATVMVRPALSTDTTPRITALCDDFLAKYQRCIEEHAPEAAREQMVEAMHVMADAWRAAAERGKAPGLDVACAAASDAAKQATTSLGCDWETTAPTGTAFPPTKAELAEAKRRALALMAAAQQPGLALAELAEAVKLEVAIDDRLIAREALDPTVRKAIAGLKPGQVSKPFAFKRGYRVIQVLEVQPPGPLSLEHRREEIKAALLERGGDQAREELQAELDDRYPIRYLIDLSR